ncbi:unnamed protein product [Calypogeia fissa]
MTDWGAKPARAKRQQQSRRHEEEYESSDELEDHLSGHNRGGGCEVCMPNPMRRERGRGGVALTSHVHYENQITPDEMDRMDGLRPGLRLTIQGKRRLKKCIWAQALFQALKACLIVWAYINHERVTNATVAACVFALIGIFSGHNALERQSVGWTKAYILCMAVATALVAYPLYRQGGRGSGWSIYRRLPESRSFPNFFNGKYLEGVQDLGSVTTQLLGIASATQLLKHFSIPRNVTYTRESLRRSSRDHRDR